MRSLVRRRKKAAADPAPSRLAWRLQRLRLTPAFLFFMRTGLPLSVVLAGGAWYFSDVARIEAVREALREARASFESRPEFMVHLLAIDGAGDRLAEEIRAVVPLNLPTSSFDLDLVDIRERVKALDPVESASVRIRPGGVLHLEVTPRVPVVIWRNRKGLALLDRTGAFVRLLPVRDERPELPVVAGEQANRHVEEALALNAAAAPLGARLHGFERIGARRWDVVLDRDQRLLLPEQGAVEALERVIALDAVQDILSRDVRRVDLRLQERPTVQMSEFAAGQWWLLQSTGQDR